MFVSNSSFNCDWEDWAQTKQTRTRHRHTTIRVSTSSHRRRGRHQQPHHHHGLPNTTNIRKSPQHPKTQTPLTTKQHLFPLLPPELRLKIWSLSLPPGRVVPLTASTNPPPPSPPTSPTLKPSHAPPKPTNPTNPPISLLHTTSESRHLSQTHYHLFGPPRLTPPTFFSPALDTLYFPSLPGLGATTSNFHVAILLVPPQDLSLIRSLAVHQDVIFSTGEKSAVDFLEIVASLGGVERLVVVPWSEGDGGFRGFGFGYGYGKDKGDGEEGRRRRGGVLWDRIEVAAGVVRERGGRVVEWGVSMETEEEFVRSGGRGGVYLARP